MGQHVHHLMRHYATECAAQYGIVSPSTGEHFLEALPDAVAIDFSKR
jgi:hypothetical protein